MEQLSVENLELVETPQLIAEFKRIFEEVGEYTAPRIAQLAQIFRVLDSRGVRMHFLSKSQIRMFRAIACGSLTAEAAYAFGGSERLVQRIKQLPPEQQIHLAKNGAIEVVRREGEKLVAKPVSAHEISNAELERIIADGKILSTFEQKAQLKKEGAEVRRSAGGSRRVTMTLEGALYESLLAEADRRQVSIPTLIADLLSWAVQGLDLGRKEKRRAPAVEKGAESA